MPLSLQKRANQGIIFDEMLCIIDKEQPFPRFVWKVKKEPGNDNSEIPDDRRRYQASLYHTGDPKWLVG